MHAAVRMYQVDPDKVDEFKRLVNETFLPLIEEAPGFRAYYALDAGDGRIASVSVFDDRAGAEASTKMAADNIRENMASVAPNPPAVLEGEVFATEAASAGALAGSRIRSAGPRATSWEAERRRAREEQNPTEGGQP